MSGIPGQRRINSDIMRLILNKYDVKTLGVNECSVKLHGPKGTLYENGVWNIRVLFPDNYPFKSPSISFINRIYHPNVEEKTGVVCLDVINQKWTPVYDLCNIFESFLPQLLAYPNCSDPLNVRAAAMSVFDYERFINTVKEYVKKYAMEDKGGEEHLDSDMSSTASEAAGLES